MSPDVAVCFCESVVVELNELPETIDCCEGGLVAKSESLGAGSEGARGAGCETTTVALVALSGG